MRATVRHSVLALCLGLAALDAVAADDIGTLFTTPEERARLDSLRRGEPSIAPSAEGTARHRKPSVTGYVQRSDGRNTIWIDGRPVVVATPEAGTLLDPRAVEPQEPDGSVRIERRGKRAR